MNVRKDHKQSAYMDHAAATPVDNETLKAMLPYFQEQHANPSAPYSIARQIKEVIEKARTSIGEILGAPADTIIFTSGGTEADNLALFGIARRYKRHGRHIIATVIEHHAILNPLVQLQKEGFEITYLPVNSYGEVMVADLKRALRKDTILISVMYANNEVGTVEPLQEIGEMIVQWRKHRNTPFPFFHTDACQAGNELSLNVDQLGVDLMTLNASKIYGPKGIGVLYKRRGVALEPQIFGGGQEMGWRSGTENTALIVGMAGALMRAKQEQQKTVLQIRTLRDYFWQQLSKYIDGVELNGPPLSGPRLANNLNVKFKGVTGDVLIAYLDKQGIYCTTGAACASRSLEPSHVLRACGLTGHEAEQSIRFTLGKDTTKKDIKYVIRVLQEVIPRMRQLNN